MKKLRKGFTLLELLVVIGIMGILSSTAMIAGQQATDAARATTIADNLEKAASAMMMYYTDNAETIDKNGDTVANIVEGANAYLKTELVATAAAGSYAVAVSEASKAGATWWVVYTLTDGETAIGAILKNKVTRMGLKKAAAGDAYDGGTVVAMQVR